MERGVLASAPYGQRRVAPGVGKRKPQRRKGRRARRVLLITLRTLRTLRLCGEDLRIVVLEVENTQRAKLTKNPSPHGNYHFSPVKLERMCYNILETGAVTRLAPV